MICKRCGAECGSEDKFCRICGAKIKAKKTRSEFPAPEEKRFSASEDPKADEYSDAFSEPFTAQTKARKKRIFVVSAIVVLLILIAAAIWLFIPQFKQSFMSPAAFYIDSESRQAGALIDTLTADVNALTGVEPCEISGILSFAAEGEEYDEETRDLLDRLNLLLDLRVSPDGSAALDCSASFDNKLFCSVLARLLGDEVKLSFPDLTDAEVTQKLTNALYAALYSGDPVLQTATGCSANELKAWVNGYLREVLRPALDEAEQSLDTQDLDGVPTSTVTFSFSERTTKKLICSFAKRIRRDETLVTVCKSLSDFFGSSDTFRSALCEEFHLTEEELDRFPFLRTAADDLFSPAKRRGLFDHPKLDFPIVFAYGTERDEIRKELEARAERMIDYSDDLTFAANERVNLIVYYQGTQLVGRTLVRGTTTLFSAFCTAKDNVINLRFAIADSDHLYWLTAVKSQSGKTLNLNLEFSREEYDTISASHTAYSAESERLWSMSIAAKTETVGGVHALTGEIKLNYGDEILTLSNEKISETDTLFTYERRTLLDDASSKFKLRANLTYSADLKARGTDESEKKTAFTADSYDEILTKMQESLAGTPLFTRFFGETAP